jgi:hypothetical protein
MHTLVAMAWWGWLGWSLLVLVGGGMMVLFYVVAPLMVRSSHSHATERDLEPTTLEDINATAREGMRRAVHDLRAEGFEVVGNYTNKRIVPDAVAVSALFVHRSAGDFAEAFQSASEANGSRREVWTLAIRTHFPDGSEIATISSPSPTIFPTDRKPDTINPYWIKDGRLLYAIHRARVENSGRTGEERVIPQPGGEAEFLRDLHRRELRRVADAGYLWLDESAARYRPTTKGAFLMTWRLLWPLKGIRAAARRRKARRELKRLGFTEFAVMPAPSL